MSASIPSLLNNFGGTTGFGDAISIGRNDDGSTALTDVSAVFGNGLDFYGTTYNGFYISNNGRLLFGAPDSTFTPSAITSTTNNPQIDPFFADVDTRLPSGVSIPSDPVAGTTVLTPTPGGTSTGSDLVYVGTNTQAGQVAVTWDDVGYFASSVDKLNAFQVVLTDESSHGSPGDFKIEFRYETINWTTGGASGGTGGLGGTVAVAGYSAGTGDASQFFQLPESSIQGGNNGTPGMLDLATTPGNTGVDGVWDFYVSNGVVISPPSVVAGTQSVALKEAGIDGAGVSTATETLTVSANGGATPTYDTTGWTSLGNGQYSENGTYGTAVLDTNANTVSYTLNNSRAATNALQSGQSVSDNFSVAVTNGTLEGNATASFAITGDDDAPVATADALTTNYGQVKIVSANTLLANDTDAEGDTLTLTGVSNAAHGTVSLNNGQVTFTPTAGYSGSQAGFSYTESDGHGGTATGTVGVTVGAAPVTPPVTPPITPPAGATVIGSGPDSFTVDLSEDAYLGNAQFTIDVDGHQIGGVQTVTASHAAGQTQAFVVEGNFGTNAHRVTVNYINDAYAGTAQTDRNLYIDRIGQYGQSYGPVFELAHNGAFNMDVVNLDPSHLQSNGTPAFETAMVVTIPGLQDALVLENMPNQYLPASHFTVGDVKNVVSAFLSQNPNFLTVNNNPAVAQDYQAAMNFLGSMPNSTEITVNPNTHIATINGQAIGTVQIFH